MFQQAFGFVWPAPNSWGPAPWPEGSLPSCAPLAPNFESVFPRSGRPLLNSARVAKLRVRLLLLVPSLVGIRERLARPPTASHTPPQPSSMNNPSPSPSTGSASRFARPCNDAAPAELQTRAPHRCTP